MAVSARVVEMHVRRAIATFEREMLREADGAIPNHNMGLSVAGETDVMPRAVLEGVDMGVPLLAPTAPVYTGHMQPPDGPDQEQVTSRSHYSPG